MTTTEATTTVEVEVTIPTVKIGSVVNVVVGVVVGVVTVVVGVVIVRSGSSSPIGCFLVCWDVFGGGGSGGNVFFIF